MATSKTQQTHQTHQTRTQFGAVGDAVEQFRTPLLAALGAGDLATQAVVDIVNKARAQVLPNGGQGGQAVDVDELRRRLDASELRKLVDVDELRKLVEPEELRKVLDNYTKAAVELYKYLAEQGEGTYEKARTQPQVARALEQLDEAVAMAQDRVEGVTGSARGLAEDVLSRVSRTTRSAGEKAARSTQEAAASAADTAAESVSEAGEKVASETRSATRKAANKADAAGGGAKKPAAKTTKPESRGTNTTRKTNGSSPSNS
jgi:heparin binding hemagglutinin HbhA